MFLRPVILFLLFSLCLPGRVSAQLLDVDYPYTGGLPASGAAFCFRLPDGVFIGGESSIFKGGDSNETWMGCKPDVALQTDGETETGGLYRGGNSAVTTLDCAAPAPLSDMATTPFTGGACREMAVACGDPTVLEPGDESRIGIYKGGPSNDYFVNCLEKPAILDVDLPMYQGSRSYDGILSCSVFQLGAGTLFTGGLSRETAVMCNSIVMTGGGAFFGGASAAMLAETACIAIEESLTGENFYSGGVSRLMAMDCAPTVSLGEPTGGYYRGGESAPGNADCYLPPCLDLSPAVITPLGAVPVCAGKTIILTASPASSRKWQRYNTSTTGWDDFSADPQIIVDSNLEGDYRLVSFGGSAGCADTSDVFHTIFVVNIPQPVIDIEGSNVICSGGSVALRSSEAHEYLWSTGQTTRTIWVTQDGNYTVTITDVNGCRATSPVTLISSSAVAPVASIALDGAAELCAGQSRTLTANTAAAYRWSNGATSQAISVSQPGKYTVRITDANGCQATADSIEVKVHDVRPAISHPGGLTICYGAPVTLSLAPHTGGIEWYRDGLLLAGTTGSTIQVTGTGAYHAVLDTLGCRFAASAVTVNANDGAVPPASITPSHPVLCEDGSVTLTAGEASKYTWSTGDDTRSVTTNVAGDYHLTVEDAFGCPSTASFTLNEVAVTIRPEIQTASGQAALCPGASVTLRVSEGETFAWDTGAATQEITVDYAEAGYYSAVAYDANGCSVAADPFEVTAVAEIVPIVDAGNAIICGSDPAILSVSPTDNSYACEWSNGGTGPYIEVAISGSYSVTIVTAEGCRFAAAPVTVTQTAAPAKPVVSANFAIVGDTVRVCPNQVNQVTLTSTEAQAYYWNTGEETRSVVVGGQGKYSVTVAYANACTALSDTIVVVLADNPVFVETEDGKTQLCPGQSIGLSVAGAEAGSIYEWYRDGVSAGVQESFAAASAGLYHAVVTGPGGCVETAVAVEITDYPAVPPAISSDGGFDICPYDSVRLTATEGAAYLWNTGDDTGFIWAGAAGKYVVTVTDEFGCVQQDSVEITVKPQRAPAIVASRNVICQGDTLILSAPAPGGSSFVWSTGETAPSIAFDDPERFGNQAYWVEVTYPEGCIFRSPVRNIYVNKAPRQPEITVVGSNHICPDLSVALIATKSDEYTYQWRWEPSPGVWQNYGKTPEEGQTFGIVADENGNYDVTVTDRNGCSSRSEMLELASLSSASVEIYPRGPVSICDNGGLVKLEAFDSQQRNVVYKWNTGETGKSIIVTQEGYYRVTVTELESGNMCEVTSQRVEVRNGSALPPPTIVAGGATTFCAGGRVTLSSSIAPNGRYEWQRWTATDTTVVGNWQQLEVAESGEYMMVFTDNKGCRVFSKSIRVTVNPLPQATVSPAGPFTLCDGETVVLAAAAGQGYRYSWSPGDATTRVLNVPAGTYTVTVTTSEGCSATSTPVVVRQAVSRAPMPAAADTGVCEGERAVLAASSDVENPEFKWWDAATGGNQLAAGRLFETPALTADYEAWVSVGSEDMCESPRHRVVVSAGTRLPAGFVTPDNLSVCNFGNPVTLAATHAGGSFSGAGVLGAHFDPALAGPGTHWVYHTVANLGCPSTDSIRINVLPAPQITFGSMPDTVCSNSSPFVVDAYPEGGVLTGAGLDGSIFNPLAAGAGDRWLAYTVTAAGCSRRDSVMIAVLQTPEPEITNTQTVVGVGSGAFALVATPAGGVFSGAGVVDNAGAAFFDPAAAGEGVHEIFYTATGADGCSATVSIFVTVSSKPTVDQPAVPDPACEGDLLAVTEPAYDLHGATLIGKGWLLDGVPFDPAVQAMTLADNGKTLQYKVTGSMGETVGAGVQITVIARPATGPIYRMPNRE